MIVRNLARQLYGSFVSDRGFDRGGGGGDGQLSIST